VSVDDTLDVYKNSGRIQELPEFPKLTGDDIKYRIGLFHGTFAKVKLYNGDLECSYRQYTIFDGFRKDVLQREHNA
jgi:hypothetical protein